MTSAKRRYWVIRTDRNNRSVLLNELRQGRLRQGWGYDLSQNLQLIQGEILKGGAWWERITEVQKEVLPQLRMLASSDDSIQIGDWILTPNLPEDGFFLIAEVTGEYYFSPLLLSKDNDDTSDFDYGHVLPVKLLTEQGINKFSAHATIRSTLRTPMRMWNIDLYGAEILEGLIEQYKKGVNLSTATSSEARLAKAWENALAHASEILQNRLGSELNERFQAAEWEEPIKKVLENLYPGPETYVRWVGGPQEYGADVIVQLPNHFGKLPWLILVQIKNYIGEIGTAVLNQLRTAYNRYSTEGKILSLVVMTTAEKVSGDFSVAAGSLSNELGTPVEVVLRKDMLRIMTEGLLAKSLQSYANDELP